jgi:hypothetical protein
MKNTILALAMCLLPFILESQVIKGELNLSDTAQIHRIVTQRGDVFLGRITKIENTDVRFLFNENIELTFQLSDLKEITVITPEKAGEKHRYDDSRKEFVRKEQALHGHERGLYLPTGFMLRKGEAEYRNIAVFYNSIDVGVSDNLNLGIGGIPLLLANLFHLKMRVGGSIGENVHLSLNANGYVASAIAAEVAGGAFGSGAISIGKPDRHLTLGAGYGILSNDFDSDDAIILQAGGSYRFREKFRLFGELLLPAASNASGLLFSGGVSWLIDENRLDFGLSFFGIDRTAFPFPFVAYGYRF